MINIQVPNAVHISVISDFQDKTIKVRVKEKTKLTFLVMISKTKSKSTSDIKWWV